MSSEGYKRRVNPIITQLQVSLKPLVYYECVKTNSERWAVRGKGMCG